MTRARADAAAREAEAERRDRELQAQIAKEAEAYQDLKQERDKALDEVEELKATVENLTQARSEAAILEAQVQQDLKQERDKVLDEVAGNAKALAASQASNAARAFALGLAALRDRRGFWTTIGVLGVAVVLFSATAVANMSGQFEASFVSGMLMMAAIFLALAVLLLFFVGRPLYPDVMDLPARRRILFHAIGSMAILLWIALTQAVAEPSYSRWGNGLVENVSKGRGAPNLIGLLVVLLAAIGAQRAQRLRFVWYALMPLIGVIYISSQITYFDGLVARNFWITTCLNVYGGIALVLLSATAIVSAWRKAVQDSHQLPPRFNQPQPVGCMIRSPRRSAAKTYLWTSTTFQLGPTSSTTSIAKWLYAMFS